MSKNYSVTIKMSIALGIVQILEYSGFDVSLVLTLRFIKVAMIFFLIGYNLPKEEVC